jgi:hypothetical protein
VKPVHCRVAEDELAEAEGGGDGGGEQAAAPHPGGVQLRIQVSGPLQPLLTLYSTALNYTPE